MVLNCWMCGGWGRVHPLGTGKKIRNPPRGDGEIAPVYVWAASRAQEQPGSVECPACRGDKQAEKPSLKLTCEILGIFSEIW